MKPQLEYFLSALLPITTKKIKKQKTTRVKEASLHVLAVNTAELSFEQCRQAASRSGYQIQKQTNHAS